VTEVSRAGQSGSLGDINTSQGDFRDQIDALTDTVRQLGGKPNVGPGNGSDPLTAPFILYVNSYTGSDTYVSGDYNSQDDGTFESKMRRISLQRLECGYTEAAPFKSLSRAIIEAGIITSRDYLNIDPAPCGDLVSIVLAGGLAIANNGPGDLSTPTWTDGKNPTTAELTAFNPVDGGILLPRGCSVISLDLRKTIIRPDYVPTPVAEQANGANRRAILKVTGGVYNFGATFMDKVGSTTSHHLLDTHHFASEAELDTFYAKIRSSFGPAAGVSNTYAQTRSTEYVIVGPAPATATTATDTVASASPYIYNMSIRSTLGMGGVFADGSKVSGFKSMVIAQYTSISLQNDHTCWQKYDGGSWTTVASTAELLSLRQDNIRINPQKRHYHIRAINSAVIQEVSVFCIGQAIHHQCESGAQLTVTNSNSNFGGCSSLAIGFQNTSAASDKNWTLKKFQTALNPLAKQSNIKKIFLGTLTSGQADGSKTLNLVAPLTESRLEPGQPEKLALDKYSLKVNDYLWIENPGGPDYRGRLSATPWANSSPTQVVLKDFPTALDPDGSEVAPGDSDLPNVYLPLAGKRIYVRRFIDTRSVDERRNSIIIKDVQSNNLRLPVRDYVIQETGQVTYSNNRIQAVAASQESNVVDDGVDGVKVELRYSKRSAQLAAHDTNVYYRKADVVLKNNKHWTATRESYGTFTEADWDEAYVHMEENYNPEGYYLNANPTIVFDKDIDSNENSITLGNTLSDPLVKAQLISAVDYQGLFDYLVNLGVANPANVLTPQDTQAARNIDPPESTTFVEFRRPSNIRLYSHAFEWPGFGSYSRALPQYQGDMSDNNRFTYYFTAQDGGKCYVSGFNEEGLQVSNRGLEDLTTGTVLSVADIGNPDREIEIPTVFETLEVTEKLIIGGEVTGFPSAEIEKDGVASIASVDDIDGGVISEGNDTASFNAAISGFGNKLVNVPGLNYWAGEKGVVTAPTDNISVKVIHVVPDGVTALTGAASVPYGFPDNVSDGTRYVEGRSTEAKTITEAMQKAGQIYVPNGASILVSVHGDLPDIEKGPLQLVNSYARVDLAGAQGFVASGDSTRGPIVKLKQDVTARATKRIPQYAGVQALSAGVVFADLKIEVDCNSSTACFLCFNGGIGIGGKDVIIEWENVDRAVLCTNSYGASSSIRYYNTESAMRTFKNVMMSKASAGNEFTLELFGSSGGLAGHGTDLIIDFRSANVGDTGEPEFTYKFDNVDGSLCNLSFMAQGSRGGVKLGGRVAPIVDFDFGSSDGYGNWNLKSWISNDFTSNQNYMGISFEMRQVPDNLTGLETQYKMTNAAYQTIEKKQLINGCCIDIGASDGLKSGPFGLYIQADKIQGNLTNSDLLLTADNTKNAYIYSGGDARNGL
jgi:hypothetical protein